MAKRTKSEAKPTCRCGKMNLTHPEGGAYVGLEIDLPGSIGHEKHYPRGCVVRKAA